MAWILQIVPQGLLLNNYLKNNILLNPQNLHYVEQNQVLSNQWQIYSTKNNLVNISFSLQITNSDPRFDGTIPSIVGINNITISNDLNFYEILVISSSVFVSNYNSQTDYFFDLSTQNIASLQLPNVATGSFTSANGTGIVNVLNWPLSGTSGIKRVFVSLTVLLSDGTTATFPNGYSEFGEIFVLSDVITAPSTPKALNSYNNYVSSPVILSTLVSSSSGLSDVNDLSITSYFWDHLVLNSNTNLYVNNYSNDNVIFNAYSVPSSNLNKETFPIVFTNGTSLGIGSTAPYDVYITANPFQLSTTNNIYFFETHYNASVNSNYNAGSTYFMEVNLVNGISTTSNTKYLRQQLVADLTTQSLTIYTSTNDTLWNSSSTYIPSGPYNVQTIFNPVLTSKVFQSGILLVMVESLTNNNNIYQSKLLFKATGEPDFYVLNEQLFSANLSSTNIYGEFKSYVMNGISTITLKSNQYGVCYGLISASSTPVEKIETRSDLPYYFNFANQTNLNTWFKIYNTLSSGNITDSLSGTLTFYANSLDSNNYNINAIEAQGSIPSFANENTFSIQFSPLNNSNGQLKVGWSTDNNVYFNNFVFSDQLQSTTGAYLPQQLAQYNILACVNWVNGGEFDLVCVDTDLAQTCSITTTVTTNFFYYTAKNNTGTLTAPATISTRQNLTTSSTFNFGISTNGYSSSNIITQTIIVNNVGQNNITVNSNNVNPGDVFALNSISQNLNSLTSVAINTVNSSLSNSINFLYDFIALGTIQNVSIGIKITNPPDCPVLLPSFEYSLEFSQDFVSWTNITNVTTGTTFNPNNGVMTITFTVSNNTLTSRYARLRFYHDVTNLGSYYFDPINITNYSSCQGVINYNSSLSYNGKLVFGLTDVSAKNASLGQFYNLPTYLRTYGSGSRYSAVVLDFNNYNPTIGGPVYVNYLSEAYGEQNICTIYEGFTQNQSYVAQISLVRANYDDNFKLIPVISLNGLTTSLSFNLPTYLTESPDAASVGFGYYPFVSLVGNGYFSVSNLSLQQSTSNQVFGTSVYKNYFTLFTSENEDYSSSYGKNLLAQNTLAQTSFSFPQVGSYFSGNSIQYYSFSNVTFTVKAATTSSIALYGLNYVDGVYLNPGDYVLLAGQQDVTTNGIYQVQYQQWVKYNLSSVENTILVTNGIYFNNTLWMQDLITFAWIPNVVVCPFQISGNNLLGLSTSYNYPQYIRLAVGLEGLQTNAGFANTQNVNSLDQVSIKISNSPNGYLTQSDLTTQWNGILQNNVYNQLLTKNAANNTVYLEFSISSSQIIGITTNTFPATFNLLVSYCGNYVPKITSNAPFILPNYGSDYRIFNNQNLIYQMFSCYDYASISQVNNVYLNSSVYALNEANLKSPQSGFSTNYIVDTIAPTLGILSSITDTGKIVYLGLSTVLDSGAGLNLGRIVQVNPVNQVIFGAWFSLNKNSYYGVSSFVAYPSYVTDYTGAVQGEPLSGFYRYNLQVLDNVGNLTQSNYVESFYFESAIIDTQGPTASVNFVNTDYSTPISITSSSIVTAQLNAKDFITGVKSYRFRILPNGDWSNWLDYETFVNVYFPDSINDGITSTEFQFKDFGNNVLYYDSTISGENVFVYTWNIISKLINNTLFTVTQQTTYNNNPVLIVGGSSNNTASLYIWNNFKLIQLQYSGFSLSNALTAMINVNGTVVIGDNLGNIFLYQNGLITGPYTNINWGGQSLPISSFEIQQYPSDSVAYVYASTLNIPRLFRTPVTNLNAAYWQVVQTPLINLQDVNVINSGLWSGNSINYSIASSYVTAQITPVLNYGIGSVIVAAQGVNYVTTPSIVVNGPLLGASFNVILQGKLGNVQKVGSGIGYTSGATVVISPPAPGANSIQATGEAYTNSSGNIIAVSITSYGYGYTQIPTFNIIGVNGIGSQASAIIQNIVFDSIYSIGVVSAGYSTTPNITLSISGVGQNAIISPSLLYRVPNINVSTSGFGYVTSPTIYVNGLTTLAQANTANGSIQSINILNANVTFPISTPINVSLSGGFGTSPIYSLTTSSVNYLNNGSTATGTILSSISLSGGGLGIGTIPFITFNNALINPQITYITSNDLLLNAPTGSIYDIKSYNGKLFITNSINGFDILDYNNGSFTLTNLPINDESLTANVITPINLDTYVDNTGQNKLFFTTSQGPIVGTVKVASQGIIYNKYQNNILLFQPANFNILTDWQLVNNYNLNGISTVSLIGVNSTLLIQTQNCQTFYASTKNNLWFNRSGNNSNYSITFVFEAYLGTQCFEIANFSSLFKISFTVTTSGLLISYGNVSLLQNTIPLQSVYNIQVIKINNTLYIYNNGLLLNSVNNFFTYTPVQPVIKFGYIFEPQNVTVNNQIQTVFGFPTNNSSNFNWHVIQLGFGTNTPTNTIDYEVNTNYVLPNSDNIRVLKNLNGTLFAVSKAKGDLRSTTTVSDLGSKVFQFIDPYWSDVTGNFENKLIGISSVYTLISPNDINVLNGSYFLTGIIYQLTNKQSTISPQDNIFIGLSTNVGYEEQNIILTIVYPYNPYGKYITITNANNLTSSVNQVYLQPGTFVATTPIGLSITSLTSYGSVTVSDGVVSSSVGITIIPITVLSLGFNTSSFTGYSLDSINVTTILTAKPKTNRTYSLYSNNPLLLSVPNNGIATVLGGTISNTVTLGVGSAVATITPVTITSTYRTAAIATINDKPFNLSIGVNTNSFVGNALYANVIFTATLNKPPKSTFNVTVNSNNNNLLGSGLGYITASSISTSINLFIGAATVYSTPISLTGIVTGGISTAIVTAFPYSIVNVSSWFSSQILGLQTNLVTLTLNTTPTNNLMVTNVITNPTGVGVVFPSISTVLGGTISTSYGISSTLAAPAIGLAITIQGAPLGYNTSPIPGLIISTDLWRIINFSITPNTITGGGANINGIAQSFTITANLNYAAVGVTTTVLLSSNTNTLSLGTTFLSYNNSFSATGYATGFSTSIITNVIITALGPNAISTSISNLTITPFLISSFNITPIWGGGFTTNNIIGGLGATAVGIVTLSAYVTGGIQTVNFTTLNNNIFIYGQVASGTTLGFGTINAGSNNLSVNFGANQVLSYISTSVTALLTSTSLGIATTTINVDTYPTYSVLFYPLFTKTTNQNIITLNKQLPLPVQFSINILNVGITTYNIPPFIGALTTSYNVSAFNLDTIFVAQTSLLGVLQTYYIQGYAQSGTVVGAGYNNYGSLGKLNPGSNGYKYSTKLKNIVKTASGTYHNLALDTQGVVWGIGLNNYYQIFRATVGGASTSTFSRIGISTIARDVYAQYNYSFIVTADNNLFALGYNSSNSLGASSATLAQASSPYLVTSNVQLFSTYNYRSAVVTFNNQTGIQSLYEFGQYQSGGGLFIKNITQLNWLGNIRNISNLQINKIDVGTYHTVACGIWSDVALGIASSGLFAWGFNNYSQIGTTATSGFVTIPVVLTKFSNSIVTPIEYTTSFIAGDTFSLAVGIANSIYFIGVANSNISTGYGAGAAQTSIANTYGFTTSTPIYRIAKDVQHTIYTVNNGLIGAGGIASCYVSGGVLPLSFQETDYHTGYGIGTIVIANVTPFNLYLHSNQNKVSVNIPVTIPAGTRITGGGQNSFLLTVDNVNYSSLPPVWWSKPSFILNEVNQVCWWSSPNYSFAQPPPNPNTVVSYLQGYNDSSLDSVNYNMEVSIINGNPYYTPPISPAQFTVTIGGRFTINYYIPTAIIFFGENGDINYAETNNILYTNSNFQIVIYNFFTQTFTLSFYIPSGFIIQNSSGYLFPSDFIRLITSPVTWNNLSGYGASSNIKWSILNYRYSVVPLLNDPGIKLQSGIQIFSTLNDTYYDSAYDPAFQGVPYIRDIAICVDNSGAGVWCFALSVSDPYNGGITINYALLNNVFSIPYQLSTYTSGVKPEYPSCMDATYITNYATTFTSGGQTYNNPVYNLVVGYSLGSYSLGYMELYAGYASNSGAPIFITSWTLPNVGSVAPKNVVLIKSIMDSVSPFNSYIIVSTASGNIYSYAANGNGSITTPILYASVNYTHSISRGQYNVIYVNTSSSGTFSALTSAGLLLILNSRSLAIIAMCSVGNYTSMFYTLAGSVNNTIVPGYIVPSKKVYYTYPFGSYELGLNYINSSGNVTLETYSGLSNGIGMSSIVNVSTNDAMTLFIDSSRVNG
jgi:hypothetical protein